MDKEVGRGQCKRDTNNRFLSTRVLQLSHENKREGLLSDCRVSVKKSDSKDDSS